MTESTRPRSAADRFLIGAAPPPRGRLATVLMTLAVVAVVAVIAVCAGGLYYFRPQIVEDPLHVPVVLAGMLDFTPPPEFEPRGTIEWNLLSAVMMRGVYYELPSRDAMLMLLQVDSRLMGEADIREHVERTLRDKGGGGPPLEITSEEETMYTVRGELVPFRQRVGKSPVDDTKYQLIEGVVSGRQGRVLVAFRVADEVWPQQQGAIQSAIQGIK